MNPTTKRRNECQDSSDRPRRPLSAFNLFYRFKRQKLLKLLAPGNGTVATKDTIISLVRSPPGLETCHPKELEQAPSVLNDIQRKDILTAMASNMDAKDTKNRQHRKNGAMNGLIGFVELGKLMNDSWKRCDPFAREVFNELSMGQRERYRKLMLEFNAGKAKEGKAATKKKRKSSEKKLTLTGKNQPVLLTKDGRSAEEVVNEYSMAETMLQLTKRAPSNGSDKVRVPPAPAQSMNYTVAPSLLDLLSKQESHTGGGSFMKPAAMNNSSRQSAPSHASMLRPLPNGMADPMMSSLSQMNQPPCPPINSPNETKVKLSLDRVTTQGMAMALASQKRAMASIPLNQRSLMSPARQMQPPQVNIQPLRPTNNVPNGKEDIMMLGLAHRVRELEGQLAAEKLRMRIRELENEMSDRRAREGALRSVLDNVMTQNRAVAASAVAAAQSSSRPSSLGNDGLWSLMSANMIHPSVQSMERAAMLSRIVEPQRGTCPKRALSMSPAETLGLSQMNKKPRHD